MKKTIYKNIAFFGMIGIGLFAASCLKSTYNDFSKVPVIIEFLDATPGTADALGADSTKTTPDTVWVRVNQTGATATNVDISYTVEVDPSQIPLYNANPNHVTAVLLEASAYTLSTSGTIKAGRDKQGNVNRTDSVMLLIHPNLVPHALGVNYLLPITIATTSSGTISGNYGTILYNFFHNIYDGDYTATVTRYNFAAVGDYAGWNTAADQPNAAGVQAAGSPVVTTFPDWPVLTVNATRCTMDAGNSNGGFGTMDFVVNADNTVDVIQTSPTLNALVDLPGATSTYDPIAKMFKIRYEYTNVDGNGNPTSFRCIKVDMTHH
jgi:hypothetical protein